jgi:hypothetical protein
MHALLSYAFYPSGEPAGAWQKAEQHFADVVAIFCLDGGFV